MEIYDVLIIGGGGAGASAAIEADKAGVKVMIVTKLRIGDANTMMAEGGSKLCCWREPRRGASCCWRTGSETTRGFPVSPGGRSWQAGCSKWPRTRG